jgi:hypothetical protein
LSSAGINNFAKQRAKYEEEVFSSVFDFIQRNCTLDCKIKKFLGKGIQRAETSEGT